ncbi:MAG: hypothetical protein CMM45_03905 [Rhodospirillaceae bacterium]|nr:hypothetical protein [Rhodospirillaceae bacterium]
MDCDVLVVGGGPVGLTFASELALQGHRVTLVESRHGPTNHPKATLLGARSMEFYRRWGLDDAIFNAALPPDENYWIIFCTRLSGIELDRFASPSINTVRERPDGAEERWPELKWSPYGKTQIGQVLLEPVLLDHARTIANLDLRHGHKLVSFADHEDHVEAAIEITDTGARTTLRCRYLVGCDGGASTVRKSLGIEFGGRGAWRSNISFYFRSPSFMDAHGKGLGNLYFIFAPDSFGVFTAIDGKELWNYQLYYVDNDRDLAATDPEEALFRAMGKPFEYELLATTHWQHHQSVAPEWRRGNIFLAGDAAHLFAPTGGVGMNTGIADAFDLSWKLDAVISGWGGDGLLASYQEERRQVAWRNSQRSMLNSDTIDFVMSQVPDGIEDDTDDGEKKRRDLKKNIRWMARQFNSAGAHLGHRYAGSPIIVTDNSLEPPDDLSTVQQSTWPGARAPHAWLDNETSTLDWFGEKFMIIYTGPMATDANALMAVFRDHAIPVGSCQIKGPHIQTLYERPLVLVRPDGHVAWRGQTFPDDANSLIRQISGHQP